ncbi:MAG TPA: hypothetical protein VM056_01360, partial [Terriglobales bacterium]|nr:hypothetical protein [Terriglobales bacterium]
MPVTTAPVPTGEKDRYAFLFPIRPGETRFQVAYSLPYNGSAKITPVLLRPVESFAVSVPTSMKVEALPGSRLQSGGEEAGMMVMVAQNATPNQPFGFKVSGTGTIPMPAEPGQAPAAATASRGPGGGLGAPINTPDPLYKYRWWIIAGVALLLVAGAAFTMGTPGKHGTVAAATPSGTHSMMETLKEESFRLESERLQGKITAEEYASAKSALDVVMKRAMDRERT